MSTLVYHSCSDQDAEQEKLLSVNRSHSTKQHPDSNTVATVSNCCIVSHSVSQPVHNQDTNTCSPLLVQSVNDTRFAKIAQQAVPSQNKRK